MMKILVLSDSHGSLAYIEQAIFAEQPDRIIFLGDRVADFLAVCGKASYQDKYEKTPVHIVSGNCDMGRSEFPEKLVLEIEGKRFYITHGHRENVKMGYMRLCYSAMEAEADIALFGHTHMKCKNNYEGLELLNPGALTLGFYGIVQIKNGIMETEVKVLP